MSMSDIEIFCKLCDAVSILSNIILEQQSLLKQSDIEKEIRDGLITRYEDVEKNLDGNMLREQEQQGKRLEALEKRDGEKWRQVTGYVITTLIGAILGVCLKQIGM